MGRIEVRRTFALSPGDLFDFISNGDNAPRWHGSITEARHLTPLPIHLGTRLFLKAHVGKRTYSWTQEVTGWDPPHSFRDRMIDGDAPFQRFKDWGTFKAVPEGTEVTFGVEYTLRWGPLGWLIDRLFLLPRVRKDTQLSLERVETLLSSVPEKGPASSSS